MIFQEVNITTARIEGLEKESYHFDHRGYFVWDVRFYDSSSNDFYGVPWIRVGYDEIERIILCNRLKDNFKQGNIHDGDRVAVLYGADYYVRAIGYIGRDLWIDVEDKFVRKPFKELDIIITSLKVH